MSNGGEVGLQAHESTRIPMGLLFDIRRSDEGQTAELLREGVVMAAVTASSAPVPGCTVERLGSIRDRPRAARPFVRDWFSSGPTPPS